MEQGLKQFSDDFVQYLEQGKRLLGMQTQPDVTTSDFCGKIVCGAALAVVVANGVVYANVALTTMVLAAGSAVTVTVVVYLEDDEASPNAMSEFERQEITARLARAFSLRDHSPVGRIKVSIIAPAGCGSEKIWSVTWAEDQLSGRLRKSPSSLPTAIFGLCLNAVRIVSTSSRRAKWGLRPLAASMSAMLVSAASADSIAVIRAAVDAPVVGMLNGAGG